MRIRILILLGLLLAIGLTACGQPQADFLAVGDPAPDFSLPDIAGGEVSLSSFTGEKPVLLYFSMADG